MFNIVGRIVNIDRIESVIRAGRKAIDDFLDWSGKLMSTTEPIASPTSQRQFSVDDVRLSSVLWFAVCGALLVLVSDVSNSVPAVFMLARIAVVSLLYATMILPVRTGATLLMLIALAGQDIVSGSVYVEDPAYLTASVWQISIGPLNPSAVFFVSLVFQLARVHRYRPARPVRRVILWFLSVPFITGLVYGGLYTEYGVAEYITDLKFPLMLVGTILLYGSLLRTQSHWMAHLVSVLFGVLVARHVVDAAYLITNHGPQIVTGVSRGSIDSAKSGINLLILFGLLIILVAKRCRFLGIGLALVFGALSVAYSTRLVWVTLILGTLVLMPMLKFLRALLLIALIPFIAVVSMSILAVFNPDSAVVAALRVLTVVNGRTVDRFATDTEYNILSRIDPIRYGEVVNVVDSLGRRSAFIWGVGYGGYYDDSAVDFDEQRMPSSFPSFMFNSGRFFNTHEFVSHVFLKHGVFGLLIIASIWIVPAVAAVRIFQRNKVFTFGRPTMLLIMIASLTAYLPTSMLQNYWSAKGLFLAGVVLAVCYQFTREYGGTQSLQLAGPSVVDRRV